MTAENILEVDNLDRFDLLEFFGDNIIGKVAF